MKINPIYNNVIIDRISGNKTTSAGIVLTKSEEADQGKVVAVGPDVTETKVGDLLLVNWNKAVKIEGEQYKISIDEVIAVLD